MIFNRKEFNLNKINIVNKNDRKFYRNSYIVTFTISNNINPTFLVYGNDMQAVIDELAVYNDEHEMNLFTDHYELMDMVECMEEFHENYIQAKNGLYTDVNCVHIKQLAS